MFFFESVSAPDPARNEILAKAECKQIRNRMLPHDHLHEISKENRFFFAKKKTETFTGAKKKKYDFS